MTNISISFFETQQFNAIAFIVLGFLFIFIGSFIPSYFTINPMNEDVMIWFFMILGVTSFIMALICVHKSYDEDKKNATDSSV